MRVALIITCTALLSACSDLRKDTVGKITAEEAKDLRLDAAKLYIEYRKILGAEYIPLKPAAWPESFKKYKPLRVGMYRDGVALALDGAAPTEQGIHVVPSSMEAAPISSGRITYDRIQDGVFWYRMEK